MKQVHCILQRSGEIFRIRSFKSAEIRFSQENPGPGCRIVRNRYAAKHLRMMRKDGSPWGSAQPGRRASVERT